MLLFILYPSVARRPRAAWFSRYRVSIKFQCVISRERGARRMRDEQRRPQSSHETCTQTNKLALFTVSDILIPVHHLGPWCAEDDGVGRHLLHHRRVVRRPPALAIDDALECVVAHAETAHSRWSVPRLAV